MQLANIPLWKGLHLQPHALTVKVVNTLIVGLLYASTQTASRAHISPQGRALAVTVLPANIRLLRGRHHLQHALRVALAHSTLTQGHQSVMIAKRVNIDLLQLKRQPVQTVITEAIRLLRGRHHLQHALRVVSQEPTLLNQEEIQSAVIALPAHMAGFLLHKVVVSIALWANFLLEEHPSALTVRMASILMK